MKLLLDKVLKINSYYYFTFLLLLWIILTIIFTDLIFSERYFRSVFQDTIDISSIIDNSKRYSLVIIAINCILVISRIIFAITILYIISFLYGVKVDLSSLANISIKSEIVFLGLMFIKLFKFAFIKLPESTLEASVIPFSILELFDVNNLDPSLLFIINYVNLFEFLYALMLTMLFWARFNIDTRKSFEMIFLGYFTSIVIYLMLLYVVLS